MVSQQSYLHSNREVLSVLSYSLFSTSLICRPKFYISESIGALYYTDMLTVLTYSSVLHSHIVLMKLCLCERYRQLNSVLYPNNHNFFLAFDFCRFCVVIQFFHPRDLKLRRFSIPDFILYIVVLS